MLVRLLGDPLRDLVHPCGTMQDGCGPALTDLKGLRPWASCRRRMMRRSSPSASSPLSEAGTHPLTAEVKWAPAPFDSAIAEEMVSHERPITSGWQGMA